MSGLFSILTFTRQALQTQQLGLEVAKNNIANVNTPGYCRQRPQFVENYPFRQGQLIFGQGVSVSEVEVLRDKFIEIRLGQEQKKSGYYDDLSTGMQQLEQIFNESNGDGLQNSLTEFFGSLLKLSSDPTSMPLRQNVLLQANKLTLNIRTKSSSLQELRGQADGRMKQLVVETNRLLEEIDVLNKQITPMENGGLDSGGLRDRRDLALQELGKILDISYVELSNGSVMVSTGDGRALVTESGIKRLSTGTTGAGINATTTILLDGDDITEELRSSESGRLGAQLDFQKDVLGDVFSRLNLMVQDLRDRFNAVHAQGFDLQGNPGQPFFVPAAGAITALDIQTGISDPSLIAAAGPGAVPGTSAGPGDNTTIRALFEISKQLPAAPPIPAALTGVTYGDFLLRITTDIANRTVFAEGALESQSAILLQLQRQRESVSGVSLDEEATDVVRYQKAFEASSRFFNVINQLADDILRIAG